MSLDELHLSVGWRRRPESVEAAAHRLHLMLTALAAIDERFTSLLHGGRSPNPAKGWRPLEVTEEALTRLLLRSDRNAANPDYAGVLRFGLGAWNGRRDRGTSVGLSASVLGPVPDPLGLRSHAEVGCGVDGLASAQVAAIVAALMDAWDPDDATRKDYLDGTKRVTRFAREGGWGEASEEAATTS